MLCAAALAVFIARTLTRPIIQLTAAVEGAGRGGMAAIPVDAGGETGVLARAFARVMGEVNAKAAALETEVQEHRRTEAARDHHASRERLFSAAVESSIDAIVTISLDGAITGWNPAAERLFGYPATEAVGQHIDLIVPKIREEEVRDILRRVGWGETIENYETERLCRDGSLVQVSLAISPIRSPTGAIIGASTTSRDITASRKTEHALRQQIEERRRIFETSQDLILVVDPTGILVQVSPSAEAILGYTPKEMIGRDSGEFLHPADLEIVRKEVRRVRRGLRVHTTDLRYIHKDGRIVTLSWMSAWSEPVRRYFFVGRDMTESRLAQETLRESEQLARGIIDTALDAFVQIDESGSIRNWNSQAEKLFGWSHDEAVGQKLGELIIPKVHRAGHASGIAHFLSTGEGRSSAAASRSMHCDATEPSSRSS